MILSMRFPDAFGMKAVIFKWGSTFSFHFVFISSSNYDFYSFSVAVLKIISIHIYYPRRHLKKSDLTVSRQPFELSIDISDGDVHRKSGDTELSIGGRKCRENRRCILHCLLVKICDQRLAVSEMGVGR